MSQPSSYEVFMECLLSYKFWRKFNEVKPHENFPFEFFSLIYFFFVFPAIQLNNYFYVSLYSILHFYSYQNPIFLLFQRFFSLVFKSSPKFPTTIKGILCYICLIRIYMSQRRRRTLLRYFVQYYFLCDHDNTSIILFLSVAI